MVKILKEKFLVLFFIIVVSIFYSPVFLNFYLPIPSDTIVGLYHPYRDLYVKDHPNGIPFKNFLITDPVRQTYIWKELTINSLKKIELPIWNPYEMSGKPLLANFQSGVFYPLNIILLFPPFYISWTIFIIFQSLLGGYFLYLYLKNQNLDSRAVLLGCISFIFSGFFTVWLEWGTIISTAIWLPLILYSIDNIFEFKASNKKTIKFILLLTFSLLCSFFAGHLQIFFYIFIASLLYLLIFIFPIKKKNIEKLGLTSISLVIFVIISAIQWIPTLQFINLSNRISDQNYLLEDGWFLPYKHLIQFVVPDFFGNPVTLNYWGTWNYGEMVGFIGIVPLLFASFALISRINKKTYFYSLLLLLSLIFSLPNFIAKLPFLYQIPFVSSSQPTRLLFLSCFSLVILSSFGFDNFIKRKSLKFIYILVTVTGLALGLLWLITILGNLTFFDNQQNVFVARRNLIYPSTIFVISAIIMISFMKFKNKRLLSIFITLLILITSVDLLRFSSKFNTFSSKEFLYPNTKITSFLKEQEGIFRFSSVDDRILPPNFATHYKLQSIEGYDPLYLKSYAQYIAAMDRNSPNISEPFGFNRIITPKNYSSSLFDLLNVKYVLSIIEIKSDKLKFVFSEGKTKVYENTQSMPRTFFVDKIIFAKGNEEIIRQLFTFDLRKTAVVDLSYKNKLNKSNFNIGNAKITRYLENKIIIKTENSGIGFLVLSDTFYPTWHAKIDGKKTEIIKTNHAFRGLMVPSGNHEIVFYNTLF